MTPFDIVTASLEAGVTLIEASAGTGKTYSITGLILRLVLEKHLQLRRILAVTFTEAATQELRDRVRSRLQSALDDLQHKRSEDEIVDAFLKHGDVASGIRALDIALQSFDEAQIFTIHGFCQRMLNDYAFESGARFETALLIDPTPLFQEIARDFWRRRFYQAKPLLSILAMAWQRSPDHWAKLLEQTRRHPDLEVLPPDDITSIDELLRDVERTFAAVRKEWSTERSEIERILREHRGLSHAVGNFSATNVVELQDSIDEACRGLDRVNPAIATAFQKVSLEGIRENTTRTGTPPIHPFFEHNTNLCQAVERIFTRLTHEFLEFAREELLKRKRLTNAVTYDDLIIGLRDAFRDEGGKAVARLIGDQYSAALIDEFQDTDPAQYEIFRTIFRSNDHHLFFIGDPKQAIYGFRGADVFTYLRAAGSADRRFTLITNWRSEAALFKATNALFNRVDNPFVIPEIHYYEVHAPSKPKVEQLFGHSCGRALNFRFINPKDDQTDREKLSELISRALSRDIVALHESGALLGNRLLRYSDMAVLVRRYGQAEEVQNVFREQGIRSIIHSDHNVFGSAEACELQQFLQGVIDPRRDALLKAALATTLIGFDAQRLFAFDRDDHERQAWLDRFSTWRQQWANDCFIAMFRDLVVSQNIRPRIVELPAGERRLTNFQHLAELLHDAETTGSLTPDALCTWLQNQRENERIPQDHFQLRLESDEDAVQIVTIHGSKGLEYPIAFCPFLWQRAELSGRQELLFHDRESDNRLTFDLRGKKAGAQKHRDWQSEEIKAEEMRLLYVAITRAKNRCYIYLPDQKIDKSPLAQLFQPANDSLIDQVRELAQSSESCIDASYSEKQPKADSKVGKPTAKNLKSRSFTGNISKVAMVASFSGLNITEKELDETGVTAADNGYVAVPPPDETDLSIFTFDRGRRTGDFFHDVLERMDFQNLEDLSDLVESRLGIHGFARTAYRSTINQLLRQMVGAQLEPGISLRDIPKEERISECEFCYPLARLTPAILAKTIGRWQTIPADIRLQMGRLRFDPIEGFMRGFIDLLFRFNDRYYLVDWKSNWLGNRPSDYEIEGMEKAMRKHNYYLQYHLYTLAVDLFLEKRLPGYSYETHFGGVFYIFLRGLDPKDASRGIFRDRPAAKTVESLRTLVS